MASDCVYRDGRFYVDHHPSRLWSLAMAKSEGSHQFLFPAVRLVVVAGWACSILQFSLVGHRWTNHGTQCLRWCDIGPYGVLSWLLCIYTPQMAAGSCLFNSWCVWLLCDRVPMTNSIVSCVGPSCSRHSATSQRQACVLHNPLLGADTQQKAAAARRMLRARQL